MAPKRKAADATSPSKQTKVDDFFASPVKRDPPPSDNTKSKPILVVLPGASGSLSKAMKELLLPQLRHFFEVRLSEGKWQGWSPASQVDRVLQICPTTNEQWYIMGNSFGNRVICAMFEGACFPSPPAAVVMCGYPMHSDKRTSERVDALQALPLHTKVMFISGSDDAFLSRSPSNHQGKELLQHVVTALPCADTAVIRIVQGGKHGVIDCGKAVQARAIKDVLLWITEYCEVSS